MGASGIRGALVLVLLNLAAVPAGAWEVRAPVVAAEPVYDSAAARSCPGPAAGPVRSADLAEAMARDLDLAACAPRQPSIVGWRVRYRIDGREYRTVTAAHPGDTLAVQVRVRAPEPATATPVPVRR